MIQDKMTSSPHFSIRAIYDDSGLLEKVRSLLLTGIAMDDYESVILVESATGLAFVLHGHDSDFISHVGTEIFTFDPEITSYMDSHCTDIDPTSVIHHVSLSYAKEKLACANSYTVYYQLHTSRDHILHKKLTWHRINSEGMEGFFCVSIFDLTEAFLEEDIRSQNLQRALKEAQANLDANNTFLSLISRDIRTPLHSIIGLTRIANAELKDISAVESYLHKISMSGTYMEETINDIRDFIRISWHPIKLRQQKIDLSALIGNLSKIFARQAKDRELHFNCRTEGISQNQVLADASALRLITVKLTENILNYTLRGGNVELKISCTKNNESENLADLCLSAVSRGIDLDPERLDILLMPYEYIMEEIHSNINSIDMDLVILKAYLHSMQGTLHIDTQKDISTGLTIQFQVPIQTDGFDQETPDTDAAKDAARFSHHAPSFEGKTAILVDDDEINLEVGVKMLENAGLVVFTAHNGSEALNLFVSENGNVDIILMDIRMPVMNGLEATRRIRQLSLPNAKTVPIIALTVNAFDHDVDLSHDAGMNRHLIKPIAPKELYRVLSEYL
ncbi:MAG: response regulator [Blautia sp.]|nr:response regulator [Blautia sp.]